MCAAFIQYEKLLCCLREYHVYLYVCLCFGLAMDFWMQQKGCIVQMVCHGMTQPEMMRSTRTTSKQEKGVRERNRRKMPNSNGIINHFDESWIKNRFHWKVIPKTLIKVTVIRIKCLHFYNDIKFWLITTKTLLFWVSLIGGSVCASERQREKREKQK